MSIKLLVADDHEVVRSGIGTLLDGSDVEIVGLSGTVEETVSLTKSMHPDVVLLDVRLGSEDGLTALEQIRTEAARSDRGHDVHLRQSNLCGSRYRVGSYRLRSQRLVTSRYPGSHSTRRLARAAFGDEHSATRSDDNGKAQDRSDSKDVPLTNRELQVLRHIALGLSNREIGTSLNISVETVKEHVQNILRKLDSTDRTAAAVWAVKSGLIGNS
ncbi:MAG: response regulator transcription factor [Pirellulaceae bacterium]